MVEASAGLQRQEGLLFATRASGSLVALSPELQRLLGISAREGRRLADSLHPHDAAMASDWLDDLLSGRPVRPLRVRVRDLAGTYRMIEWDGLAIPHERLIVCSGREVGDPAPRVLSSGNGIELDVPTRIARAHDRSLDLTASEFNLLRLLVEKRGEVQDAETIAREAFGYQTSGNRNFLQAHVSRLRRKLEQAGIGNAISTVRGFGYVLR